MKKCAKYGAVSIASILFGYPSMSEDLQDDLDSGMVVLGGCVIRSDFEPDRHCNECFYECPFLLLNSQVNSNLVQYLRLTFSRIYTASYISALRLVNPDSIKIISFGVFSLIPKGD